MTQQPNQAQPTQPMDPKVEKQKMEMTEFVQTKIDGWVKDNSLVVPPGYALGNAIQSAYLKILSLVDKNKAPVLQACEKYSIAHAIENMAIQGLTVDKNQGYFIAYGNQLNFQRSYFGTIAVAKRFGNVADVQAQVIVQGDEVDTEMINGELRVTGHKIKNFFDREITYDNIKGAYCIVKLRNGGIKWEVMTRAQILAAWNKSPSQQGVHKEFPDQMAKKTVIGRALKLLINSSDDYPILVKAFNESGYVEGEDDVIPALEETAFTELVDADAMMAEQAPEAPKEAEVKPLRKAELKSEPKIEQATLSVGNPF